MAKIAVGILAVIIGFLTAGIAYPPPRATPQWSVRDPILLWEEGRRPGARVGTQPSLPAATVSAARPTGATVQPTSPRKVAAAPKPTTQTPKAASKPKPGIKVAKATAQVRAPLDDRGL